MAVALSFNPSLRLSSRWFSTALPVANWVLVSVGAVHLYVVCRLSLSHCILFWFQTATWQKTKARACQLSDSFFLPLWKSIWQRICFWNLWKYMVIFWATNFKHVQTTWSRDFLRLQTFPTARFFVAYEVVWMSFGYQSNQGPWFIAFRNTKQGTLTSG